MHIRLPTSHEVTKLSRPYACLSLLVTCHSLNGVLRASCFPDRVVPDRNALQMRKIAGFGGKPDSDGGPLVYLQAQWRILRDVREINPPA